MTVVEAKEYLLANACCTLDLCNKCPFIEDVKCLNARCNNILGEAIDKVYEEVINNETN